MRRLKQLAALVLTGTLLLAMAGCSQTGSAQQSDTVTVAGSGEVLLEPDLAVINLGVESTGATPEAARSANATAVNATVDAVKALGVEEKDIQTSSMNLGESYTTTGYEMSTRLTVTVRSVDSIGQVLDAAIAAGTNELNSVRFGGSSGEEAYGQALDAAVESARQSAEKMAAAEGRTLGKVLSVQEETSGAVTVRAEEDGTLTDSENLLLGRDSVTAEVIVTFELN